MAIENKNKKPNRYNKNKKYSNGFTAKRKNNQPEMSWEKFANEFANSYSQELYPKLQALEKINRGSYQPSMGQDYLQSVNISPYEATQDELKTWLKNPSRYDTQLSGLSEYLENSIMQYKRTVDHFASLLLFRYDLRPLDTNKNQKEVETWISGYNRSLEFLRKFNIPYQFAIAVEKAVSTGGYFGYLNETKDFITLLEIPSDYCYIVGKWDLGWRYAIDLTWFDKIIGNENMVPELYLQYKKFVDMRKMKNSGEDIDLAPYQYYAVPCEKSFVLTFDLLRPQIVPPFSGVFRDALSILEYKDLLKQKTQLDTWKMIAQEIPLNKEGKPAIDPKVAKQIIAAIQSRLPTGIIAYSSPMKSQEINFSTAQNQNTQFGGESQYWRATGVNGVISDSGDKTVAAVGASVRNDFGFVEHIYRQCENFINFQLWLISKTKKFRVKIYGNRYTENEDIDKYLEAVVRTNFPVGKLFGLLNYEPYEVDGVLEGEELLGWKDKLKPILSAFNTKGITGDEGRPKSKNKKDGGATTEDYESNQNSGEGGEG